MFQAAPWHRQQSHHRRTAVADVDAVEPFVNKFRKLREQEELQDLQMYNGDETGLF